MNKGDESPNKTTNVVIFNKPGGNRNERNSKKSNYNLIN